MYLTNKKPIKVVASNHKEWLSLRKGIGSSEIATLMGCNKWQTPYQLWLEKTGQVPSEEQENFFMKMGHKLEPVIAELWSEETGKPIIKGSEEEYLYVHPEYDFLRASPDREFGVNKTEGILECKSTQYSIDAEQLPEYWFCQVQYQMGIAQIDYNNIAWLTQGREFGYAEVYYNKEFFEYMVEVAKKFWYDNVLGGIAPECTTVEDVALRYKQSSDKSFEAGENLLRAYSELKEVKAALKEMQDRESELKGIIQLNMRDCDRLTYEGQTLCTWKSGKEKEVFNAKKFSEDYPDIYAKYVERKQGSRTFLIK